MIARYAGGKRNAKRECIICGERTPTRDCLYCQDCRDAIGRRTKANRNNQILGIPCHCIDCGVELPLSHIGYRCKSCYTVNKDRIAAIRSK